MKLLIVDDEELTRTGLVSSIDWKSLGIREIYQADDGLHGLEMARTYQPDIILCDVRMPRMDGISMLQRIESFLPDTAAIFMSGYSDKEYLKAAIRLKAITYIEKPLDLKEVQEAILEAREIHLQKIRSHHGEALHSLETASRLAQQLTVAYGPNKGTIEQLAGELSLRLSSGTFFTAYIVKLNMEPAVLEDTMQEIFRSLEEFLSHCHLSCLHLVKRQQYLVYFLFGATRPTPAILQKTADFLGSRYAPLSSYYITYGETVSGISRAYHSYASAVVLMQSSFFFPENTVLFPEVSGNASSKMPDRLQGAPEEEFARLLNDGNQSACSEFLNDLYRFYFKNSSVLPNQAKDLYYKLFIALEDCRKQQQLPTVFPETWNIVDTLEHCFSYQELHRFMAEQTDACLSAAQNAAPENPTIYLIKDYISRHYMNETLSVRDISAHVFLSASYVCTFFKNETNQTLNQYLTEYRMEKAKQLLSDPRYKITDISSKVGYSDGNYFGKSFKKYTGVSPSEYREKIL